MGTVFLLSVSLALDALAVSVAEGAFAKDAKMNLALKLAIVFGTFQFVMAFVGAFLSSLFASFLYRVDDWLAFVIFLFLGLKMIKDGLSDERRKEGVLSWNVLALLGLATSVDALAAGMTLSLLPVPAWLSVFSIGAITFGLCFFGTLLGVSIQRFFTRIPLEVLGGLLLIGLGVRSVLI